MHVVITGASSGIGAALARAYAKKPDCRLTLVARRRELLDQLAEEVAVPAHVAAQDLSDSKTAAAFLPLATDENGPVDVLINNAGFQIVEAYAQSDWDAVERMLQLNFLTPLRLSRAVLPSMIERGQGTLIDVASVAAFAPTPGMVGYAGSKAGFAAASETLRAEVRPDGVHVLTVYPGPIRTALGNNGEEAYEPSLGTRLQVWGEADDLAREVIRAADRRKDRLVYPRAYVAARHMPAMTRMALDKLTPPLRDSSR